MAEPNEAEIELGHAIINDYIEGDRKLVPCGNRIAQALAAARRSLAYEAFFREHGTRLFGSFPAHDERLSDALGALLERLK